jgi:microcystin-dependent protein
MIYIKKVAEAPLATVAKVIDSLQDEEDRVNAPSIRAVDEGLKETWQYIYPVGSIYMSTNSVNPSSLFGGTWDRIKDRFLLAAGDYYNSGSVGGTATNTLTEENIPAHSHTYEKATAVGNHTLTVDEIPSHTHSYSKTTSPFSSNVAAASPGVNVISCTNAGNTASTGGDQAHNHPLETTSASTSEVGSGTEVNNMPPYITVNVWVRTA